MSRDVLFVHVCSVAQYQPGDIEEDDDISFGICFVWRYCDGCKKGVLWVQLAAISD